MQPLQQLPKAQRLFKEYVDYQVEQLISSSQNLSAKYLNEREELIKKQKLNKNSIKEIENSIKLLDILIKTPFELRQNIEEVRGLETEEIQSMKQKYEELLSKYQKEYISHIEQDSAINEGQSQGYQNQGFQEINKLQASDVNLENNNEKRVNRMKVIRYGLQTLEVITYSLCIMVILYRIFI